MIFVSILLLVAIPAFVDTISRPVAVVVHPTHASPSYLRSVSAEWLNGQDLLKEVVVDEDQGKLANIEFMGLTNIDAALELEGIEQKEDQIQEMFFIHDAVLVVIKPKSPDEHLTCILPDTHRVTYSIDLIPFPESAEIPSFLSNALGLETDHQYVKYRNKLHKNLYIPSQAGLCEHITMEEARRDFMTEYVQKSKPVIIKRGMVDDDWKAFSWTLQGLKDRIGLKEVHVKISESGIFEGPEDIALWGNNEQDRDIPDFVRRRLESPDRVIVRPASATIQMDELILGFDNRSKSDFYLEYTSLNNLKPIAADVTPPSWSQPLKLSQKNIWLGGNTTGKLHFDAFENLMGVVSGSKEFVIFHPHQNENLYEGHMREAELSYSFETDSFSRDVLPDSTALVMSPVHIGNQTELSRYPDFEHANNTRLTCLVEEGDILFLPSFWWHEVRSMGHPVTLAVNLWFEPYFAKAFPCKSCRLQHNRKVYPW
eukprot:TRINITY_DN22500_c0_g1_i1.p1 TRINITY_DN22500_c0_g1~~TRINITY_DN22500_c0_g1_i1.p1  ORF type:complete len:484 (+),score=52.69 TRINITY_DN22500_c0_g1_i1:40-1491(+)